jgi:hypothetical protein
MNGFVWVEPHFGTGGGKVDESSWCRVSMTRKNSNKSKKTGTTSGMAIAFYIPALAALRWMIGDKIIVGYDNSAKMIAIKRVTSGGYTLTANGGVKTKTKKPRSARVTIPKPANIDSKFDGITFSKDDAQIVDGMLLLGLPS